jgi:hypothetical protein
MRCDEFAIGEFLGADGVHLGVKGNEVYTQEIVAVMEAHFNRRSNARPVDQNPQPVIIRNARTVPLTTLMAADWKSIHPGTIAMWEQYGDDSEVAALSIANTDGRWPEVYFTVPGEGICLPVQGTAFNFDFETADRVAASIFLYFGKGTPTAALPGEWVKLNDYFPGARYIETGDGSKGDLGYGQVLSGSFSLAEVVPPSQIDGDGFVTIRGMKLFIAGDANMPVTIREFSFTTDGTGVKPVQDYEDSFNAFWLIVGIVAVVVVLLVAALLLLTRRVKPPAKSN